MKNVYWECWNSSGQCLWRLMNKIKAVFSLTNFWFFRRLEMEREQQKIRETMFDFNINNSQGTYIYHNIIDCYIWNLIYIYIFILRGPEWNGRYISSLGEMTDWLIYIFILRGPEWNGGILAAMKKIILKFIMYISAQASIFKPDNLGFYNQL